MENCQTMWRVYGNRMGNKTPLQNYVMPAKSLSDVLGHIGNETNSYILGKWIKLLTQQQDKNVQAHEFGNRNICQVNDMVIILQMPNLAFTFHAGHRVVRYINFGI